MASSSPVATSDAIWKRLGIRVTPAEAALVTKANSQLRGGVILQDVDPDGPAGRAGMVRGDVLVGLHQFETLNAENIIWVLNHPDLVSFSPLKFFLVRSGQVRRGMLP